MGVYVPVKGFYVAANFLSSWHFEIPFLTKVQVRFRYQQELGYLVGVGREVSGAQGLALAMQVPVVVL